jgi:hypothetical protein
VAELQGGLAIEITLQYCRSCQTVLFIYEKIASTVGCIEKIEKLLFWEKKNFQLVPMPTEAKNANVVLYYNAVMCYICSVRDGGQIKVNTKV